MQLLQKENETNNNTYNNTTNLNTENVFWAKQIVYYLGIQQ